MRNIYYKNFKFFYLRVKEFLILKFKVEDFLYSMFKFFIIIIF